MQKKLHTKLNNFKKQILNQVWFPKDDREGYVFRYGIAFLLGFGILRIITFFPFSEVKAFAFILFTFGVVIAAFLGNLKAGLLLTGFSTAAMAVLYYLPHQRFMLMDTLEIGGFFISSVLISSVIPFCKRVNLVKEFNLREENYKLKVIKLTDEKKKAEQEIKIRDEFISIASHELKTPLTTTLLKLQTALHNVRNVSLANFSVQNLLQMLESAELQTQRLAKMINDLLNVSIIQTGQLDLERETCDLSIITQDVVNRFKEKAEKEGIEIRFNTPGPTIGNFDKIRLEQVITNLISNAMKYGNNKPIDVNVQKNGKAATIVIRDHGIGIPKESKERIFNLFERAVGNNEYKGLGIGLYITNQIVKAHEGHIYLDSKKNKGSEFIVEVPLH